MKKLIVFLGFFSLAVSSFLAIAYTQEAIASNLDEESEIGLLDLLSFNDDLLGQVYLKGEFLDGDLLKMSVLARDMASPILGMSFHLNYEGSKLAFLKYVPGTFLERGGDPFYLVSKDKQTDSISFGETLRRDDSFPLGDGLIVDFYFQIIEEGTYDFNFDRAVASSLDTIRQDLDRIDWNGISLNREHPDGITGDNESGLTVGSALNIFGTSRAEKMALFTALSAIAAVGFIIAVKKREEKRHT